MSLQAVLTDDTNWVAIASGLQLLSHESLYIFFFGFFLLLTLFQRHFIIIITTEFKHLLLDERRSEDFRVISHNGIEMHVCPSLVFCTYYYYTTHTLTTHSRTHSLTHSLSHCCIIIRVILHCCIIITRIIISMLYTACCSSIIVMYLLIILTMIGKLTS